MKVQLVYFSPTHSSKKVGQVVGSSLARALGAPFSEQSANLPQERSAPLQTEPGTILVCAFPVYGGRIAPPFAAYLSVLNIKEAQAIPIAVYGNRDIDDALLEACDILAQRGATIPAAISAVAQHTFDAAIGQGRPNAEDVGVLENFAAEIAKKIQSGQTNPPQVPGNRPYKQPGGGQPITPMTSDACNFCGICAKICPMGVIDETDEHIINPGCITCAACVKYCPQKAKSLPAPFLEKVREMLAKLASTPKQNQLFI